MNKIMDNYSNDQKRIAEICGHNMIYINPQGKQTD